MQEQPRYNARPTQLLPIVINEEGKNKLVMANWGLSPAWMKGKVLFNTRAESVAEKPYFGRIFKQRRCLIPADGFYEWGQRGRVKQPYRFVLKTHEVFGFAGIWERDAGLEQLRFSIMTTTPNELVGKVHDRMPVIVPRQEEGRYMQPVSDPGELLRLLAPYPANLMELYPVSTLVNSSKNDFPDVISPIEPQ